ncbi:histone-lysine N-methyltransferase SETMAR-like [Oratosquilla oratoria]|uniref:histone-lysine N-methyltransferase SETMAR-like n=1 Tax=Oratosquilla oratoria TaxID=337810 RepID=UPI003F768496
MRTRETLSRDNLTLMQQDPESFLAIFVTMDKAWVYHFHPETKEQWKHNSLTPKKVTTSAGKVMDSVFWYAKGVLFIDYLSKDHTIKESYYPNLLTKPQQMIKEKPPGMLSKGVILHKDDAPAHASLLTMAKIRDCGFECLPHPTSTNFLTSRSTWLVAA